MQNDSLGDRMKRYEDVPRVSLVRRTPVIMRLDGKAFHTLTRGMKKPFDDDFMLVMRATAMKLCKEVQGCKLAYTQSDEISLLLTDYDTLETQGWFDYGLQKMVSISASIATLAFNNAFEHEKSLQGMFDSRAFNVPREDVANYFVWRQKDAIRNSIQAVGQAHYSPKQLHGKNCNDIREMLLDKNIDWNTYSADKRHGTCIRKLFGIWQVDHNTPVFTEGRKYIEDLVSPPDVVIDLPNGHKATVPRT